MNNLEYYTRKKDSWDDDELYCLRNEYENQEMNISEIGDIHKRTPGSISYKLKSLGLITHNVLARGYDEYKNSDLYREIVTTGRITDADKKAKKETKLKNKIESAPVNTPCREIIDLRNDVSGLKNEISSLKQDVKEMLRLMNALYDFESQ